ncbi:adaptor protein MecA [Acetivibrio cellulolyticus]|uniref:adaptor protein MecA n=1 Tax=Acetivibrio cellulolyticus TaxID=35830 RepID=UPI0001E2E759|nr:adaptor protein MecA [Acetivibrio cellulolyticus]
MKIEKINDNKIKVTISLSDLQERNIDFEALNYNSPATQELFWDMMEQAEIQFGFNTSESQLAIEASPDDSDGFVIFISKLDEDSDFESIQKYIKNKFKKSDLRVKKKSQKVCSSIIIYSFEHFDHILSLCNRIKLMYTGESTLYKLKSTYYMVLTKNTFSVDSIKYFESLLNEYGSRVSNTSYYEGYLEEYADKIAEYNAVEVITSYF